MKSDDKRRIVHRLVRVPDNPPKGFWSREMKVLSRLALRYNWSFLWWLDLGQKFNSLTVIAAKSRRETLDKRWLEFRTLQEPENRYPTYELSPEKTGEDGVVTKKPTLREFLS